MLRSFSDVESGRIVTAPQRAQILARTPTVTKEMLQKLQNAELTPKSSVICGYKLDTKQVSVLLALFFLFILSSGVAVIFWCTNTFETIVYQQLAISNNTNFKFFANPNPTYAKIHLFNYTNVDAYAAGDADKLIVEEVGPYTYKEIVERFNFEFLEDGNVVRYQQKYSYQFMPLRSNGRQYDRVVVPNFPMITAATMSKHYNYFSRLAVSTMLHSMESRPFLKVSAHNFIMGYSDNLFKLAKSVLALSTKPLPFDTVGLLSKRVGNVKTVEMYTGKDDIRKLGVIKSDNEKGEFDSWLTEACNAYSGSEGAYFDPIAVKNKEPVDVVVNDICRHLRFEYVEEVNHLQGALSSYRYAMPENIFAHPTVNPENQCYCTMDGTCPPHGLFNMTPCSFDTPFFLSQPHFLNSDPKLLEAVEGLNPDPSKHSSYIDIHPTLGFVTEASNRVQNNIHIQKLLGLTQFSMFNEDIYLPVDWIDFGLKAEDLLPEVEEAVKDVASLVKNLEVALQYVSLLMAIFTFFSMLLVIRGHFCGKRALIERTSETQLMNGY